MSDSYHFQIEPEPAAVTRTPLSNLFQTVSCADLFKLYFPSGSVLQVSGDKVVGRTDPEPDGLPWDNIKPGAIVHVPTTTECIADLIAYGWSLATAVAAEVQRAPLPNSDAWRYTGKERDDFPEFVVTRETVIDFALPLNKPMPKGGTLHAHPGVGSALLRG